jgi:hypothetical protein
LDAEYVYPVAKLTARSIMNHLFRLTRPALRNRAPHPPPVRKYSTDPDLFGSNEWLTEMAIKHSRCGSTGPVPVYKAPGYKNEIKDFDSSLIVDDDDDYWTQMAHKHAGVPPYQPENSEDNK